jgi:UDP-N-acetylmuramoylalanine--D-glutamate ligase
VIGFCRQQPLAPGQDGVQLDLGRILVCVNGNRRALAIDPSTLSGLAGVHNQENLLAAVATVVALGADAERATGALLTFAPLPHRCETVAQAGGVTFIDDSKATNAGAAARSLESFASKPPRILWVAGGRAKGAGLDALAEAASGRVRQAFLIGEAAHEIEAAVADLFPVSCCDSIEDAVAAAAAVAREGDVVLLAPGCASFDQFTSFEERGERFGRAARRFADSLAAEGEGS